MKTLIHESIIDCSAAALFEFHANPENLPRITPPGITVRLLEDLADMKAGSEAQLEIRRFGIALPWRVRFAQVQRPEVIVDVAMRSPFRSFRHEHRFIAMADGRTMLRDTVTFELPFQPFSRPLERWVARDLEAMFVYRHARTAGLLEGRYS